MGGVQEVMLTPGTPSEGYQWHLTPDNAWELLPLGSPLELKPGEIPVRMHEEDFE